MFAIIGLGNPGSKYDETRHNIGFWVVDSIAADVAAGASWQQKFDCEYLKTKIGDDDCLLVKPQKYMNLSGDAIKPLTTFFKITAEEMLLVHDDLDLDPGIVRIRRGGSAAGHNGVRDIYETYNASNFIRIRVGIGHPRNMTNKTGDFQKTQENQQNVSSWVLSKPGPKEKELLESAVLNAADAVRIYLRDGLEAAQAQINRRNN